MHCKRKQLIAIILILAIILGLFASCKAETAPPETDGTSQAPSVSASEPENTVDKRVCMDPSRDVEERVEALLAQMTLEEKVGQMVQPEKDGNANKTVVPMTKTESLTHYEDFTLTVYLDAGTYEFKFMTNRANAADFRLDRIEFEYLGE